MSSASNNWGWSEDGEYYDTECPHEHDTYENYVPDPIEQEEIDAMNAYYDAEQERYNRAMYGKGISSSFFEDYEEGTSSTVNKTVTPSLPSNYTVIPKKTTYYQQPLSRKGLRKEGPDLFEIFTNLNNVDVIYISMLRRGLEMLMASEEYKTYPVPTQHWIELTWTMLKAFHTVNVERHEAQQAKG